MILRWLLVFHAVVTLAAGVVLFGWPAAIPGTVGISLAPNSYLLCYLLGAAEIGIAFLSFATRKLQDRAALRIISGTFVVFHLTTAAGELWAYIQGLMPLIIGNILLRLIIAFLFIFYGIYQLPDKRPDRA